MEHYTNVDEIPKMVAALRETSSKGVTRPLEWRRRQMWNMRTMVEDNMEEFTKAVTEDLRRPYGETVLAELYDVVGEIVFFNQNLEAFSAPEVLPTPLAQKPMSFEIWKEPYGVVTIIAPWNFPLGLLLSPCVAALAAGNTCILKPSEVSKACDRLLAKLIPKYFDSRDVAIVNGGVEQATALLAQKVDHIMYTGGGHVARIVMAAAAKNLTPVTLELGGSCPAYVDESANIKVTARRLVYTKNINSGQVCIAPNHAIVHEKVRDSLVEHMKSEYARLFPGEQQKNVDKARIINDHHFQRVSAMLEGHGGQVAFGGKLVEEEKHIDFTIVLDPSPDSALMQGEIFGPILPIVTVKSIEEAIALCGNGRPTPLASYVFTRNEAMRKKWLAEVESGGACVNDCIYHITNRNGGLSGKGESGMGTTRGHSAFKTFSHRKVVGIQPPNFDPLVKYPPFPTDNSIQPMIKAIVLGEFPAWIKLFFWGVVGAAAAGVAFFLSKHVSVSVEANTLSVSIH